MFSSQYFPFLVWVCQIQQHQLLNGIQINKQHNFILIVYSSHKHAAHIPKRRMLWIILWRYDFRRCRHIQQKHIYYIKTNWITARGCERERETESENAARPQRLRIRLLSRINSHFIKITIDGSSASALFCFHSRACYHKSLQSIKYWP